MSNTDDMRRIRYSIGRAEDSLDIAIAALYRATDLMDAEWASEFAQDAAILRSKIETLHDLVKSR